MINFNRQPGLHKCLWVDRNLSQVWIDAPKRKANKLYFVAKEIQTLNTLQTSCMNSLNLANTSSDIWIKYTGVSKYKLHSIWFKHSRKPIMKSNILRRLEGIPDNIVPVSIFNASRQFSSSLPKLHFSHTFPVSIKEYYVSNIIKNSL